MNRSYSLIETPEQEAIARLLTNGKIPERYLAWNKKRGFYPMTLPGSKMTQVPFDELVQIIGADGVQAVRALAGMVGCLDRQRYTPSTHPFFEYDQDD